MKKEVVIWYDFIDDEWCIMATREGPFVFGRTPQGVLDKLNSMHDISAIIHSLYPIEWSDVDLLDCYRDKQLNKDLREALSTLTPHSNEWFDTIKSFGQEFKEEGNYTIDDVF